MATAQTFINQLETLDQSVRSDSLESVLSCIQNPLEWFSSDSPLSPSQQLAIVRDSSWKKHLFTVFHDILPSWAFSLSGYRQSVLSTAWIEHSPSAIGVVMAKTSLPILLECISADRSLDTLEMIAAGLKHVVLTAFKLYPAGLEPDEIPFFCSLLCSIPGRLTNALGGGEARAWYSDRVYYGRLAQSVAQHAVSVRFSGELLGKMIRQGYEDQAIASLFPIALQSPTPFPSIFEYTTSVISTADQITKAVLSYALQHAIQAQALAPVLFDADQTLRVQDFLLCALLRLSKWSLANDRLAKLAVATALCAGLDLSPVTKQVIQLWSDPVFIKHAAYREKEYVTIGVLVLLGYLDDDTIRNNIMPSTRLVMSVSFYFDQAEMMTAKLGALIAEAVSSRLDTKPLNTGLLDGDDRLLALKQIIKNPKEDTVMNDKVEETTVDPLVETDDEEEKELDPDASYLPQEESEEEFQAYAMEEESDDEGNRRETKNHKKPAFIRDLVRYLADKEDPVRLEIGLKSAEEMIRQSTGKGTELDESCKALAEHLISFPETFEIDHFRQLQQNALTALIAGVPKKVTGYVIDTMYDRNTSAGQSQIILASITLAVRELAGWSPKSGETSAGSVEEGLADRLGTSLFVSKRLEVEKKRKTERNRLAGLAGPVFFFPLLVGWWEGAQGRIKYWIGNNPLLIERFIMTLNIILHSSTNTPDKRSIVREYFEFALSMRYANITCKRSLLLGIEVIINQSYKDQETLLFQDFTRELVETKEWLEEILENSTADDQLKELTIRILLRLSEINQQQLLKM
ncbi:hypothetical protein G6F55_007123 [Rhizopus delemar]|uniref:Telomere length regulation protein conserved domain-containing protein n=3 Tax=Rhizopus TaxID=4842 RepID=I1CDT2_RHIO9|nr:hypothetical protein RO3G_11323 [Rhizopus delemar RA 99-880]KAG1455343.1 hypothetical protein G6F55_007123 [Rhizopus delemar]KAG1540479.1 hypothetical protein G6F51_008495 [Rhizopus arrhizus]KAG1494692.1 hypothetical protein G6F54_007691 [Rhizopus delemar]KAG1508625.1 hypothetical protein G6F53_008056 [Rhizopus delemar]|eukprot:EIE86612.1 hypothetical protein RO3G_11323 [Rhizopus delemar RA 99-880]